MVVSQNADVYNHADVMRLTGGDRSPSGPVRVTVHYRNQPSTPSTPAYVPGGSLLSSSTSARRASGRYVRSSSSGEVSALVNRLDGPRGEVTRPPRRVRFDLPPQLDGPVNGQDCVVGGGVLVHSRPAVRSLASPQQEEAIFGAVPSLHSTARYRHGTLTSSNTAPSTLSSTLTPAAARTAGAVALVTAAREGDDDALNEILRRAAITGLPSSVVNYQDSGGRTAASHLAGGGNLEMLELLLQIPGVDVNLADKEGNTPLHFAAQAGHVECVHYLLSSRPDVQIDARNSLGFTPLMKAALQGRTKCARVLLHAGASPTMRDCGRGLRADQWARYCGRYVCAEAIEKLARSRLLQRSSNGGGLSSLAAAGWGSQPDIASLLSRVHGQANNSHCDSCVSRTSSRGSSRPSASSGALPPFTHPSAKTTQITVGNGGALEPGTAERFSDVFPDNSTAALSSIGTVEHSKMACTGETCVGVPFAASVSVENLAAETFNGLC